MFLSVVIPTRNRHQLLSKALESMATQTLDDKCYEIVVVDNGSTDATRRTAEGFAPRFRSLRYVLETVPGLHAGRHAGLNVSTGDILVFADDDIRAFPTWLEGIAESFSDATVAMVGGKNLPNFECDPPDWVAGLWQTWDGGRYNGTFSVLDFGDELREIPPEFIWGCNFSIRKSVLLEAGGFHPDGMPSQMIRFRGDGETHVSAHVRRSSWRAVYNPKASVRHWVPRSRMTHAYLEQRARMQGISDSYTLVRSRGGAGWSIKSRVRFLQEKLRDALDSRCSGASGLLDRLQRRAYWAGFRYHQEEVRKDPELLAWVTRSTYLES